MRIARKYAVAAAMLFVSACESLPVPEPEPDRSAATNDTEFKAMLSRAMVPNNPFAEDRNLTAILSRTGITLDQRLQVLAMRAAGRSTTGSNLLGAIADYEEIIQTAPRGHRLAKVAAEEKAYSETQRGHLDRRVGTGPGPAANWNNYFSDLMQLGRHQEAVSFAKRSKLRLSAAQAERLTKAGYLCEGAAYSGPSFQWGSSGAGYHVAYWCDSVFENSRSFSRAP